MSERILQALEALRLALMRLEQEGCEVELSYIWNGTSGVLQARVYDERIRIWLERWRYPNFFVEL